MEHQLGHEEKECGNSIRNILCRLIVTCVEGVHHIVLGAIACVEVVRTYGVSLQTDTEELSLETRLHVWQLLCQDFIERVLQNLTIAAFLYGDVLAAIVYPDVHDTWIVLELTHSIGNATATLGVLYPELADSRVGIRQ